MIRTARAAGLALVLAAGFLWAPACAEAPAKATVVPPIVYKQRTLNNGLQVLTSLDRTTPNVSVQVWYGVGSKDAPQSRSGFAHLFEHMMFKATRAFPAASIDRFTDNVGGFHNSPTSHAFTHYT